jgi:serine/threonine-protein kinase
MNLDGLQKALADRYQLKRELGQGGMATVYLAEDPRHQRQVAIKVLKPELAAVLGAERFVQEIQTTAQLQHPHILPLFDSGMVESQTSKVERGPSSTFDLRPSTLYYVMPYIEGETLRDKLNRETQLSVEEAVRITTEVADALDYAHRHGVIHRDIKPENILLHDGRPMVADFGIALALSAAAGGRMTETGMSLGTPHYMSPEQATADKEITGRSDIYSLASVLYEMLTGNPPHTGSSAQQIIMKIVAEEAAPVTQLRKSVPPNVAAAVGKALEKVPADRFASAKDFADALTNPAYRTASETSSGALTVRPSTRLTSVLAAVAILALALAAWGWLRPVRSAAVSETRRVDLVLPDSAPIEFVGEATIGVGQTALASSPDGRSLVYVAGGAARPRLYVRPLDRFEATPLAGTEGAFNPFYSPDGRWIGFFADNQLKKVPSGGGPVTTLADAPLSTGAAWSTQGRILFLASTGNGLRQISADGGRAEQIANWPANAVKTLTFLPGERWLLCTAYANGIYFLLAHSVQGGEDRILVRHGPARPWQDSMPIPEDALIGSTPRYDRHGTLLYTRGDGTLLAVGFDPERLETHGEPVIIAQGVRLESWTGHSQVSLGGDGTLAYVTGSNTGVGPLAWLDRSGRLDTLPFPAANSLGSDIAPDGARAAVAIPAISGSLELWIYDLRSGERQRLLSGLCYSEIRWTADGRGIYACLSGRGLVRIDPARPGQADTLTRALVYPSSASRDGRLLLLGSRLSDSTFVLPLDGSSTPQPVPLDGAYLPAFSPDGHWVAYLGRAGGVFVEPFPITGEVYRISGQLEGDVPSWSPGGAEIVFPSGSRLYSVAFHPGSSPRFDTPRQISTQRVANMAGRPYAMAPDGRRFLMRVPTSEHSAPSIHLVLNGFLPDSSPQ